MSLSEPLVYEVSEVLSSGAGIRDSVRFCFSGEPIFEDGRVDDIMFGLESDLQLQTTGLFVYCPQTASRHVVHGALPGIYGLCTNVCPYWAVGLLSQVDGIEPRDALDTGGCLIAIAQNAWNFKARLVDYNPDYRFITIRTQEMDWEISNSITYVRDTLWHYSNVWDSITDGTVDSLVGYLRDGSRVAAMGFPGRMTWGAAFDGETVWAITDATTISAYTRIGATLGSFAYPSPWGYPEFVSWTEGHLWIGRDFNDHLGSPDKFLMDELDEDSSLATGEAVVRRTLEFPYDDLNGFSMNSTDAIVTTSKTINVFDENLIEIRSEGAPVFEIVTSTFDGSTLWVLHHGPPGAITQATLLSRFTLE